MRCPILLADMNSFYASVHQAMEPRLKGKPVIVGGDPARRHGIVLAASVEAKACGVKTGMTVREAAALCPQGIFLKPRHSHYINFSARIIRIMKDFSPLVEPFSIDEAFMDVSGCGLLFGSSLEIAVKLKARIKNEVGVLCSVGVGPNKLLAKMAAGMQKPDGLTLLDFPDVPVKIWPLPVRELFGVGSRLEKRLRDLNIHTIGDLARYPLQVLKQKFGLVGHILHLSASGIDYSPVDPCSLERVRSIGHQITLPRDYWGYNEIKVVILELCEIVCRRVRLGGYAGRTVSLTLKDTDFLWLSRARTMNYPTASADEVYRVAVQLLHQHWPPWKPVRMVGVSLAGLVKNRAEQLDLFGEAERARRLHAACDRIKDRFGEHSILRAVSLTPAGVLRERGGEAKHG
ncbi:MAG: DNA polymerase IV [Pelotomaculum sp.]|uniref:DNA polymerase IV n=1 Tax=Pelotomaculum thermopropionicum (strain DSM 13744 / JCM 10971 / SI) TaxID=370438 RepID=DPO4_PELTS|nr:RecName: Full=DNA polymerase IV; Short=Pol IV [Pelotomaculum thermopropionicum SI]NPV73655.1 DNA polymerase IV [Pelotomaculum sp.]BAF59679.1 nucleotidyltransferase/DNA polymerase [Pelotomaculum thermopropionicum SI]